MKRTLIGLWLLSVLPGCGSPGNPNAPASVKGNVTYNGERVTGGTLAVHKDGSYPVTIQPDGTFHGVDLPDGEALVTVETESIKPKDNKTYRGKKVVLGPTPAGASTGPPPQYVQIPAKYASAKTTPLKITLKKGPQEHHFELTD
jgi:hypothetical protein